MVNGPPVTDNYKLHDENVDVFDLCLRLIEVSMCRTLGEIDKTEVRLFWLKVLFQRKFTNLN